MQVTHFDAQKCQYGPNSQQLKAIVIVYKICLYRVAVGIAAALGLVLLGDRQPPARQA